jgi:hypothetical protein
MFNIDQSIEALNHKEINEEMYHDASSILRGGQIHASI